MDREIHKIEMDMLNLRWVGRDVKKSEIHLVKQGLGSWYRY